MRSRPTPLILLALLASAAHGLRVGFGGACGSSSSSSSAGTSRRRAAPVACAAEPAAATSAVILSISESVRKHLDAIQAEQRLDELIIRVGVTEHARSLLEPARGLDARLDKTYAINLCKPEDVDASDTVVEIAPGKRAVIDPKSLESVQGMRIDYSDDIIGGGFQFHNPNANGTCGCGARAPCCASRPLPSCHPTRHR